MSRSRSQSWGFAGSTPAPVPLAGVLRRVLQTLPYSPRKRPVAKAAPRAAEPKASVAGTESRGMGWIMARAGGGGGGGKVTCAGATGTALGPLGSPCSSWSGYCSRSCGLERHLAALRLYCKPCPSEPGVIWWPRLELRLAGSKTCM